MVTKLFVHILFSLQPNTLRLATQQKNKNKNKNKRNERTTVVTTN